MLDETERPHKLCATARNKRKGPIWIHIRIRYGPLYESYVDPQMDPVWVPIWILYGRLYGSDNGSLYGLYGFYMTPFMDHRWTPVKILYGSLYGSYTDPM